MTRKKLEQGVKMQQLIDDLQKKKENLEEMEKLCFENMDIAKEITHTFTIRAMRNDGCSDEVIRVSAGAAYSAVCRDIKEIETELEKLDKEFLNL